MVSFNGINAMGQFLAGMDRDWVKLIFFGPTSTRKTEHRKPKRVDSLVQVPNGLHVPAPNLAAHSIVLDLDILPLEFTAGENTVGQCDGPATDLHSVVRVEVDES